MNHAVYKNPDLVFRRPMAGLASAGVNLPFVISRELEDRSRRDSRNSSTAHVRMFNCHRRSRSQ